MPGMREARKTQEEQEKLLREASVRRYMRLGTLAEQEGKKLEEKLKARGWPPKEIEARVSELKREIQFGTDAQDKLVEDLIRKIVSCP